jgi:hypothetical protein
MFNLNGTDISYILFSPEQQDLTKVENNLLCEKASSILYSKDYTVIAVKGHYKGELENSFIALQNVSNNDILREDCLYLLETFKQNNAIVKYKGQTDATKISNSGEEKSMSITIYDSNLDNKTYLYNGVSFSFLEKQRFYFPKEKSELKKGMILEYFDNKDWIKKEIIDINLEYDNLYQLLMKYDKVRIPVY